ncbi:LRR 7 and LRR 6 and LRR 8 domain containing protein [Trichuris trichiura]|uniref:LRR 7 and LRR 6 and LRR 8 domain containing protein n=1 Tax=Trichuris trichiura TaxID=36087 RepID=A0A077YWH1_TRITR|nr:LRR 7 and LRR 6 and LRR 8 domain containing protein [Trichuris trichiura]
MLVIFLTATVPLVIIASASCRHPSQRTTPESSSSTQLCPNECHCDGPKVCCGKGGLHDQSFVQLMMRLPKDTEVLWIVGNGNMPNNFSMSQEFVRFPKLRQLHLLHCGLYTLGKRVFQRVRSLRDLHLENNIIGHLTADAFDNTNHLERLILRRNEMALDALPTGSFAYLRRLRHLDLSHNKKGARFASNLFSGMTNLRTLILNGVQLFNEDFQAFTDLPALQVLQLSGCSLKTLPMDALSSNRQLRELDLSDNHLTFGHITVLLSKLPLLQNMELARNELLHKDIVADVFAPAKRLIRLGLADNSLGSHIANNKNNNFYLAELLNNSHLTHLDLCNNGFTHFDSSMLASSASTIEQLKLCANGIETIEPTLTRNMSKLKLLNLAKNRLKELPRRLPAEFGQLETLNLSANALSSLDRRHLESLGSLRVLDLSKCKFSRLPPHFTRLMPHLDQVYLQENPWNCRCDIGTLRELLLTNKPRPSASQVQCISPKDVQGLSVLQIDEQAFCTARRQLLHTATLSNSNALLVIVIGMILIVLLVNLTIALMCIYNRPTGTYRTNEEKRSNNNDKMPQAAKCSKNGEVDNLLS